MLMQNDPFRDLEQFVRSFSKGDTSDASASMDAYRRGEDVWVHVDLPGVTADAIDIDVERNVLTISAQRSFVREEGDQVYLRERRQGGLRRQVHLGDQLDVDGIEADYADGVLTLRIPVLEKAKPRKITIGTGQASDRVIDAEAA